MTVNSKELYERGIEIREEIFGPAGGRAKVESSPEFLRDLEDLVTEYCFGAVWGREGISRATRSLVTIAALAATGKYPELEVHTKGAIANGATPEEIKEVLMNTAIYAGIPAAVGGFRHANIALGELEAAAAPKKAPARKRA